MASSKIHQHLLSYNLIKVINKLFHIGHITLMMFQYTYLYMSKA